MTLVYHLRHNYESISGKTYWRWADRPLGNVAILKDVSRRHSRNETPGLLKFCTLKTYAAPGGGKN